jgi:hypothetical protein
MIGDKNKEILERERIISIVLSGKKSDYWIVLKDVLEEWMAEEKRYIASFSVKGIVREADVSEYNRSADKVKFLNKLLNVNDTIIFHNSTLLERMKIVFKENVMSHLSVRDFFVKENNHNGGRN